jgi:RNA polymerase sigma-70 factor (ECF subfamily)
MNPTNNGHDSALSHLLVQAEPLLRERFTYAIPTKWRAILSVDDLIQETFTDAFLSYADFTPRGEGSFQAWLTSIAKHNLLSALEMLEAQKRGGKFRRVEPATAQESAAALYESLNPTSSTPSRFAAKREAVEALQSAVAKLPPDYRRVVELCDLEGRTAEEAAAALQCSEGALFMRRARAHRTLARLLGAASAYLSA